MSLVRFDLGAELDELRREINQIFSAMPALTAGTDGNRRFVPAMDTYERDGRLFVSMDLPGMERDDIDVEVRDDVLVIKGHRTVDREEAGDTWHRHERSSGRFERTLRVPDAIEADQVEATFDKGVLLVSVPITERQPAAAAKVEVKGSTSN